MLSQEVNHPFYGYGGGDCRDHDGRADDAGAADAGEPSPRRGRVFLRPERLRDDD